MGLAEHQRISTLHSQRACWLTLSGGWWPLVPPRMTSLARASPMPMRSSEQCRWPRPTDSNRRAKPWIWDDAQKTRRHLHRPLFLPLEEQH